jgi:hypothetical protein
VSRVLIACEFSGIVRDAFIEAGHDAVSCDLEPTEAPGPHYQGDVRDLLEPRRWDLMIAHPPCTYMANSGVQWLHKRPERWALLDDGAAFFRLLLNAPVPRIAVENPLPHRYALERMGERYAQRIQPWWFGSDQWKGVCLWLRGLPPLLPTGPYVLDATPQVWWMGPSSRRAKDRSRFFPEIARAMAAQWGPLLGPAPTEVYEGDPYIDIVAASQDPAA